MTTTTRTITLALCGLVTAAMSVPITYDQRQSGDLNVQVELKDVSVVALLDSELLQDYTDYDYFYDYADFTIKPIVRPTTSSGASIGGMDASPEGATTWSNEEAASTDPTNGTGNGTVNSTSSSSSTGDDGEAQSSEGTSRSAPTVPRVSTTSSIAATAQPGQAARSRKRCKSGYVPGGNGLCRRANRRWLSLLP